jgi:hypothetical protein
MSLSVNTTLVTNLCTAIGYAHNAYIRVVGDNAHQTSPMYWLEQCKALVRGGNDLTTGIPTGSTVAVAAQGTPDNTVAITGGNVSVYGQTVAVSTAASYGTSATFSQTCTDGSALTLGQFYDCALAADHKGVLAVFRGAREDMTDTHERPVIPTGYVVLAMIRVKYQAGGTTVIQTADITPGVQLTSYSAPTNDPEARIFSDFDSGQQSLIGRKAVKGELGFAFTSLDNYIKTITASQGLGTNGQGLGLLAWAKSTHQTASPWDFPVGFMEFVRYIKNNKDASQRLATISFTGSGTATVTDLKKTVGFQDKLELVVTSVGGTGAAASTINVTTQTYGASSAIIWTATVPANQPNGTVINLASSGTAPLQDPLAGTAQLTAISGSTLLSSQPVGTYPPSTRLWTALVPTSPVTVVGGTSGDAFAVRNTGTL